MTSRRIAVLLVLAVAAAILYGWWRAQATGASSPGIATRDEDTSPFGYGRRDSAGRLLYAPRTFQQNCGSDCPTLTSHPFRYTYEGCVQYDAQGRCVKRGPVTVYGGPGLRGDPQYDASRGQSVDGWGFVDQSLLSKQPFQA